MIKQKRVGVKPLGESGGHSPFSFERPKKVEWVQTENMPMINLLREILEELKKLNAK
jgi:hypothetical protein